MECVFGLVGDGFVIVASDTSAVNSILVHKTNEDKIMKLDSHKLVAASGESGDRFVTCPLQNVSLLINDYSFFLANFFSGFCFFRVQFTEYIQKNVALYQFRNGIPLTTAAAANFTRGELATALRKVFFF
jgi:20S proteasome subunit beta 4